MKHNMKPLLSVGILIFAAILIVAISFMQVTAHEQDTALERDKALKEVTALDLRMVPSLWHHGLNSTRLDDYHEGEHLIISDIWTGALGSDAVVKHNLEVKVSAWGKQFSTSFESEDKHRKEMLTVTLHKTETPTEMRAEFDHTVYEGSRVVLRFSGMTLLARVN
jgi:hypothetical protein